MMIYVPLNQINDNPYQKRQVYDEIDKLAVAIKTARASYPATLGLMQVPRGRIVDDDGTMTPVAKLDNDEWLTAHPTLSGAYIPRPGWLVQLAFGHRRLRAFQALCRFGDGYDGNYYYMPVHVDDLSDDQMIDSVWGENYDRKDISAVEQAELLAAKLERPKTGGGNRSQRDVADEWGLDRSTIANRLSLLQLPPEIQQANREGKLSERQCLALKPVAQAKTAVLGQGTKWGGRVTGHYHEPPVKPADYIAHVLENPTVTSDEIRDYGKRILSHAGRTLPKTVAQFAVESPDVQQPLCAGCKFRVNDTCLKSKCVDIKMAAYGRHMAQAVAKELNLPYSEDPSHFAFATWNEKDRIEKAHQGGHCPHLVVGWLVGGHAARPFGDLSYANEASAFGEDSRAGVCLGHQGELLASCLPPDPTKKEENVPDKLLLDSWRKRQQIRVKEIKNTAKRLLIESLAGVGMQEVKGLLALTGVKIDSDDPNTLREQLAESAFQRGPLSYGSDLIAVRETATKIFQAADFPPAALSAGSLAADVEEDAMVALTDWYERRSYASTYTAKSSLPAIEAARAKVEPHRTALTETSMWLDLAHQEITAMIQKGE